LEEKFGVDLAKEGDKSARKIMQVLQKGVTSNEDEYRLILAKIDAIYSDNSKKGEVNTLNKLLNDYHK